MKGKALRNASHRNINDAALFVVCRSLPLFVYIRYSSEDEF